MLYFWDEYVQNVLTCLFQSRDFNKRTIVGYYVCNENKIHIQLYCCYLLQMTYISRNSTIFEKLMNF